jgi:hypothetical protein
LNGNVGPCFPIPVNGARYRGVDSRGTRRPPCTPALAMPSGARQTPPMIQAWGRTPGHRRRPSLTHCSHHNRPPFRATTAGAPDGDSSGGGCGLLGRLAGV